MRAYFATALVTYVKETWRRPSSVFVDNFVKMISDAKRFIWNFCGNLVNKADDTVIDFNSVRTVITA